MTGRWAYLNDSGPGCRVAGGSIPVRLRHRAATGLPPRRQGSACGQSRCRLQPAPYTIFGHLDADLRLYGYAGPGHWNDLDMLVPGVPTFHWNLTQELSQIGVWAMEASPLIISTNTAALTTAEVAALKNPAMINIDRSGQAPTEFTRGNVQVVMKNYLGGGRAVLLANRGAATITGTIAVSAFGFTGAASVRDVWAGTTKTMSSVGYRLQPAQTMLLVVNAAG